MDEPWPIISQRCLEHDTEERKRHRIKHKWFYLYKVLKIVKSETKVQEQAKLIYGDRRWQSFQDTLNKKVQLQKYVTISFYK